MCASVARAGAVRVSSCNGRPSQAERSVGESVEISREAAFSALANSASNANSRRSLDAGIAGGRVADRPHQSLAAAETRQDPGRERGSAVAISRAA